VIFALIVGPLFGWYSRPPRREAGSDRSDRRSLTQRLAEVRVVFLTMRALTFRGTARRSGVAAAQTADTLTGRVTDQPSTHFP